MRPAIPTGSSPTSRSWAGATGRSSSTAGAEPSVGALAARADALGIGVRLPFPAGPGLERVRDKVALARVAAEVGVGMPETYAEGPAGEVAAQALAAPSVVKPRDPDLRPPLTTAVPVESTAGLGALLAGLPPGFDVVVQERAPGPMLSLRLSSVRTAP